MELDDDEGKARRNLVTAATLVIGSWWLEIPLAAVITKLVDKVTVPGPHLIAAAYAVLLYAAIRYRFSADGQAYVEKIGDRRAEKRGELFLGAARAELDAYTRSGRSSAIFPDIAVLNDQKFRSIRPQHQGPAPRGTVVFKTTSSPTRSWNSGVHFTFAWQEGGTSGGESYAIELKNKWRRAWLATCAYLAVTFYTPQGVQWMVPIVFCLAAELVLLLRLLAASLC